MTTTDTNSTGWLNSILATGLGIYTANAGASTANDKAKQDAKTAQANAAAASNTTKLAILAAGVVAGIIVLVLVFRRK